MLKGAYPRVARLAPVDPLFHVETPLGVTVRTTRGYWREIVEHKHPVMAGKVALVQATLARPEQIRRSRSDPAVYLYYRPEAGTPYQVRVVAKHLDGEGFIVTAYRTDRVKEGERVWTS